MRCPESNTRFRSATRASVASPLPLPPPLHVHIISALLTRTLRFDKCLRWFYGKSSILLSNVPGRKKIGYLAGARVTDMCFWVPLVADGCVGLSIYSDFDHVVFSCKCEHVASARDASAPKPFSFASTFNSQLTPLVGTCDPEVLDSPSELCEEYVKAFSHLERMVLGKNYENTTDRAVEINTTATLQATRVEERNRRKSKVIEQGIDVAKGVAQYKAAKASKKQV